MSRWDELRAAAKAATPGPWNASTAPHPDEDVTFAEYAQKAIRGDGSTGWVTWVPTDKDGFTHLVTAITGDGPTSKQNAAYLAAANPSAVLALLEERDELEKLCEELAEAIYGAWSWAWEPDELQACKAALARYETYRKARDV